MDVYHVDGGALIEPPRYQFHDAYFSVLDDSGNVIHVNRSLGNIYSGLAEFYAIKWAVENIKERPIKITSDCKVAISWSKKGAKTKKHTVQPLDLDGVVLEYQHNNLADQYNSNFICYTEHEAVRES